VTHLVDLDDGTVIATVEVAARRSSAGPGLPKARTGGRGGAGGHRPFTPYAKAVRHPLPHARLVVDKFHVLRLFARSVDLGRSTTLSIAAQTAPRLTSPPPPQVRAPGGIHPPASDPCPLARQWNADHEHPPADHTSGRVLDQMQLVLVDAR
jgi:hypothetical protein